MPKKGFNILELQGADRLNRLAEVADRYVMPSYKKIGRATREPAPTSER